MDEQVAEYWANFEKETGERVVAKSLGELIDTGGRDSGMWGLLVLTDKAFWFRGMKGENWILSVFRRPEAKSDSKKSVDIVIPREEIAEFSVERPGFLGRLFGPSFRRFSLSRRGEEGPGHSFSVDPKSGFLDALGEASSLPE